MTDSLSGKVAIVTGAASRFGIGQAIVTRFLEARAKVILSDVDEAGGRALAERLGKDTLFVAHDVRDEAAWQRAFDAAETAFGPVGVLVNNAGKTGAEAKENCETVTLANWRDVQSLNVEGVVLGCKHGIARMKESGGSIVNISSMAALVPTATLPAYGASKAAVRQISQTIAQHCARQGYAIRCNSVHPGIIETELVDASFSAEQIDLLRKSIPSGRLGAPDDVAQAVLYLASDKLSGYVTGTRLIVDGGSTMQ